MSEITEEISKKFYTAQEAQKALTMDRDTFNSLVKRGIISKRFPFGESGRYKHGMYSRYEIDTYRERLEATLLSIDISKLTFRPATVNDLDMENRLAYIHFGKNALTPERIAARRRYLEVNPLSTFHLYNSHALAASINIVPLKHPAILEFREGKRGWQFPDSMIEQFEPTDHRLECIIIDMMATTSAPRDKREQYVAILLHHLSSTMKEWGNKGIDIKSIDACGGTDLGRGILERAEFEYTGDKNGRDMYHLDIDGSNLVMFRSYKNAINNYYHVRGIEKLK